MLQKKELYYVTSRDAGSRFRRGFRLPDGCRFRFRFRVWVRVRLGLGLGLGLGLARARGGALRAGGG